MRARTWCSRAGRSGSSSPLPTCGFPAPCQYGPVRSERPTGTTATAPVHVLASEEIKTQEFVRSQAMQVFGGGSEEIMRDLAAWQMVLQVRTITGPDMHTRTHGASCRPKPRIQFGASGDILPARCRVRVGQPLRRGARRIGQSSRASPLLSLRGEGAVQCHIHHYIATYVDVAA